MKWLARIAKGLALLFGAGVVFCAFLRWQGLLLFPQEAVPGAWEVFGVDVSSYQGEVNWSTLTEQGVRFAFCKATEGSGHVDPTFQQNWQNAQEAGVLIGAYHFFSYDSPGETQAENFIAQVPVTAGTLPPVVDVEFYGEHDQNPPSKEETWAILGPLLERLEEHYGVKPILYATYRSYKLYLVGETGDYPLWITRPIVGPMDKPWTFWQYSHSARLEGYVGKEERIDLNVFRGSFEELKGMTIPVEDVGEPVYIPSLGENENQKRLEAGKEAYLWLDQSEDGQKKLLEYTNYNLLKTPPEQIERYVRMNVGTVSVELFCGQGGEVTSILLFNGDKEPQEFCEEIEYHMMGIGDLTAEDLNFDGCMDLRFFIGGERGGQHYYAAFLWEPETESYVYEPTFSQISRPQFDYEHCVIWGGCEFLFGYYYNAFEFVDGAFVNTHRLVGDYPDSADWEKGAQCTECMWVDGENAIVGQTFFPKQGVTEAVEEYIKNGTVWEGWAWCDPRAYESFG